MAKEGWRRGSRGDEIKLNEFRDPVTRQPLNSIGEPRGEQKPRPVGSDTTSTTNRDGLT